MAPKRDPLTGRRLLEGIHPQVSERTGAVTYRARVSWLDADGKRHQAQAIKKTVEEAEAWLLAEQVAIRRGERARPSTLTVAAYWPRWIGRKARQRQPATIHHYAQAWRLHIAPAIGDVPVQRVTRDHCQRLIDALAAAGYAGSSIRATMAVVSGLFRAAVRDGLITASPAVDLDYPGSERTPPVTWSPLQLRRFLMATADTPDGPLWRFLALTGCRIGEAVALQWRDLRPETGTVWIGRTLSRDADGHYVFREGTKRGMRGRTVPVPPAFLEALRARRGDAPDTARVFPRGLSTVRKHLHRHAARLGLPRLTPHGFRHSFVSFHATLGTNPQVVADLIGHSSPRMTLEIYTTSAPEALRNATDAIAGIVGEASSATTSAESGTAGSAGGQNGGQNRR